MPLDPRRDGVRVHALFLPQLGIALSISALRIATADPPRTHEVVIAGKPGVYP